MIHFKDRPLGLGNPYAPNALCNPIAAAAVAGGLSLLGNLVGGSAQHGFTKEQQKLQSKLNREEMNHSMNLQQQYQNMVWSQGSAKEVAGMKNAGINPAGFNGPSAMSASPSTGGVGPQGPNMSGLGSDAVSAAMNAAQFETNVENVEAQTGLTKSQANYYDALKTKVEEETKETQYRNSEAYRDALLQGMKGDAARAYADAAKSYSDVELNGYIAAEKVASAENLLAQAGLARGRLTNETTKTFYECAKIMSDMELNERQGAYYRAAEYCAYMAGNEHKEAAELNKAKTETEKSNKNYIEQKTLESGFDTKTKQLTNVMLAYQNQVLQSIPPEDRAKWEQAGTIKRFWLSMDPSSAVAGAAIGSAFKMGSDPVTVKGFGR